MFHRHAGACGGGAFDRLYRCFVRFPIVRCTRNTSPPTRTTSFGVLRMGMLYAVHIAVASFFPTPSSWIIWLYVISAKSLHAMLFLDATLVICLHCVPVVEYLGIL
jgi:hypothetical protein